MQKILISCDDIHSPITLSGYVRGLLFEKDREMYFDLPFQVSDFRCGARQTEAEMELDFDAIIEGDKIYMFLSHIDKLRADPYLISLVEAVGLEEAIGKYGKLKIIEVPDDVKWSIGRPDVGPEWVQEDTRYWS